MKKDFIKICVALLLLLGIAIPLSLHREKKIKEAVTEEESKKMVAIDMETIDTIKFSNKSGEVVFERRKKDKDGKYQDEFDTRSFEFKEPQKWLVTKPYRSIADSMVMDGFLNQIYLLSSQKTIQETKEQKSEYQLDQPKLAIEFYEAGKLEPKLTIAMGTENPAATGFYFMSSDKPGIYLGDRILQPYENQPLDEWRQKTVIGFANRSDIEKIGVIHASNKDKSFEAVRVDSGWKMEPVKDNLPADTVKINQFLSHIDGIRAGETNDDSSLIKSAKLIGEVSFRLKNRKEPLIYKVYDKSPRYYIQRNDIASIFTLPVDQNILPEFQQVVAKRLINQEMSELLAMKVTYGKNILEVVKEKSEWKLKQPIQDAANVRRIESIIKVLSEVQPKLYLKNKVPDSKGQKIKIEMDFSDKNKNVVTMYQIGNEFFGRIEDGNQPRTVLMGQIPTELYDHFSHIRDDSLIPFTSDTLKRLVFKLGKATADIEISNGKRKMWYLNSLEDVSSEVSMKWKEQFTAEEMYSRISELYLMEFIDKPDPNAKYDAGSLEIFSADGRLSSWKIAKPQGGMVAIYSPERKVAGKIAVQQFNEIAEFLESKPSTKK